MADNFKWNSEFNVNRGLNASDSGNGSCIELVGILKLISL
jgi:hypothetical protein